jgi:tRNA dimethylallyltransferase
MSPPVIAIVGATATGKSVLSLAVAEAVGGEVINADALQFYRGMDIGTAKLTVDERRGIPHHQIDTLEVTESASVARFQQEARADVKAIHARGHRAIVVGGSGLYVRALLDRLDFPGTDPEVRSALEARAETEGPGALHRELLARDPQAAASIPAQNARRIVRALEVIALTGRPYSARLPRREYWIPTIQVGVRLDYAILDRRIDHRAARMWNGGLVQETEGLVANGLRRGTTAQRAVGYAEALRHLDGELGFDDAVALTAQRTRRLARRQGQWFVPDSRVTWVEGPISAEDEARAVKDALAAIGTLDS